MSTDTLNGFAWDLVTPLGCRIICTREQKMVEVEGGGFCRVSTRTMDGKCKERVIIVMKMKRSLQFRPEWYGY